MRRSARLGRMQHTACEHHMGAHTAGSFLDRDARSASRRSTPLVSVAVVTHHRRGGLAGCIGERGLRLCVGLHASRTRSLSHAVRWVLIRGRKKVCSARLEFRCCFLAAILHFFSSGRSSACFFASPSHPLRAATEDQGTDRCGAGSKILHAWRARFNGGGEAHLHGIVDIGVPWEDRHSRLKRTHRGESETRCRRRG